MHDTETYYSACILHSVDVDAVFSDLMYCTHLFTYIEIETNQNYHAM